MELLISGGSFFLNVRFSVRCCSRRVGGTEVMVTCRQRVVRHLVRHLVYLGSYLETQKRHYRRDTTGRVFSRQHFNLVNFTESGKFVRINSVIYSQLV